MNNRPLTVIAMAAFYLLFLLPCTARAEMQDYAIVKLQALDKGTARISTFDVRVGSTVQFGPLFIRAQACRKSPPIETPESASFLQIWENDIKTEEPQWIFSGWMFASSPALSAMDHPLYDVWVLDCLESGKAMESVKGDSNAPEAPEAPQVPENKNADQTDGASETSEEFNLP